MTCFGYKSYGTLKINIDAEREEDEHHVGHMSWESDQKRW